MSQKQAVQLKLHTLADENLDQIICGGSLFGWGQNTYDAGSDFITLKFLFTARDIPYERLQLDQWALSPIHAHEIGHYVLTSYTRLGIILRKVSALIDGLIPIVAEEMLTQTGKVWVPLKAYLEKGTEPHLVKLVNAIETLELLRYKLTEGWRISHELFSFCLSVVLQSLETLTFYTKGVQRDEVIGAFSIMSNDSLVKRVGEKLSGFEHLFEGEISNPSELERLICLAKATFKGAEKREVLEVLRAVQVLSPFPKVDQPEPNISEKLNELFFTPMQEMAREFAQGKLEHKKALEIFRQFAPTWSDAVIIAMIICVLSDLYAPVLPPEELLQADGCVAKLQKIDEILPFALERYMHKPLEEIVQEAKQVSDEICRIQKMLHSVTLKDLNSVRQEHILGTLEWFEALQDELNLNRRQKEILRGLLAGSQIESGGFPRTVSTQGRKVLPKVVRPLFQTFLALRRCVGAHFSRVAKVYEGLESLGLKSFRALENAVSLYYPLLVSATYTRRFSFPSINICCDCDNIVLALGASKDDLRIRHAVLRSVLDALRQALIEPGREQSIVFCPIGAIGESSDLCSHSTQSCIVGKLASLFTGGTLLICSKTSPAKMLRLERNTHMLHDVGQVGLNVQKRGSVEYRPSSREFSYNVHNTKEALKEALTTSLFGSATEQFLGKGTIRVLSDVVDRVPLINTLWAHGLQRRQRQIDRSTRRSVSDMWLLLKKLADAPIQRRS